MSTQAKPNNGTPLEVVPSVDIQSYMGTWYEIARLPNKFQKKCAGTRANYQLRSDGKVSVLNQCQDKNDPDNVWEAEGTAYVADSQTNAKLKVSFVPFFQHWGFFSGDYWIIALDSKYQYVMVGEPARRYLWILSRSKNMPESLIEGLLAQAKRQGFNLEGLIRTPQWR